MTNAGHGPYKIERRTTWKKGKKPLSGYAMDISIRVNADGTHFLQDLNSKRNVMPHTNSDDLIKTVTDEIKRNEREHFGSGTP